MQYGIYKSFYDDLCKANIMDDTTAATNFLFYDNYTATKYDTPPKPTKKQLWEAERNRDKRRRAVESRPYMRQHWQ